MMEDFFVSRIPRVITNYGAILFMCSDFSFEPQTMELVKDELGYEVVFPIRLPGGPGLLHEDSLCSKAIVEVLETSISAARTNNVVLISHQHCKAYAGGTLFKPFDPTSRGSIAVTHLDGVSRKLHSWALNPKSFY